MNKMPRKEAISTRTMFFKTVLILLGLWAMITNPLYAQFSSHSVYKLYTQTTTSRDTVYVMMFNGITASTDISFTGSGADIKWYKYADTTNPISAGTTEIYYPDDATGYVVNVDGRKYNVWVIDYKNYLPVINSITPASSQSDECKELKLNISSSIPSLLYKTPSGTAYALKREFTLKYGTQKWTGDQLSGSWSTDSLTYTLTMPVSTYTVTAPLCDTSFRLYGDQYAKDLGISQTSYIGSTYKAVAVECHITTLVTERTEKNEGDRPSNSSTISFSVPFSVEFSSNGNLPVPTYYKWEIYKDNQLIITRTDKDQRYTFSDYGEYTVKLTASNSVCVDSDSVSVSARIGAALEAPVVFTPDGNGVNDEFRILYKSLLTFECWIYNRWGRQVYHWRDPQKGWDGKIGGRDAAEGVYVYVVKASGYGLDPKKSSTVISSVIKKGSVTLLRKHD